MNHTASLLHSVLWGGREAGSLNACELDLLVREARHANLLGRLFHRIDRTALSTDAGVRALAHTQSAATMAQRQHVSIRHEAKQLRDTLAKLDLQLVLLKGAAYVLGDLPASQGRVFADIDILVPKASLGPVEAELMLGGWMSSTTNAYDQRYYRRWMHELPAMQHVRRGTTLDVHHTILPPTSRLHPDPAALLADSREVNGLPGIRTLAPCDMVLHSATHLFHEGEPDNLLRDLSDLDLLLRHFSLEEPEFWAHLQARAEQLELSQPLRLALRYTRQLLATPVPDDVLRQNGVLADRSLAQRWLDRIYLPLLSAPHPSLQAGSLYWARKALYVRGHWLRMPAHLLAYHLAHKALMPARSSPAPAQVQEQR